MPKREIRESIEYLLAACLSKLQSEGKLQIHEFFFMSNHYHLLGTDVAGCLPHFLRDFHSILSRQLNAIRGIRGENIEGDYGHVTVASHERILEHAVYTLANPIATPLVAYARHWPGASSLRMEYGQPVKLQRPKCGIWAGRIAHVKRRASLRSGRAAYGGRSEFPLEAELTIDRPAIFEQLSDAELRSLVRTRLAERENQLGEERVRKGIRVLGRKAILATNFLAIPTPEEMFSRRPSFSASSQPERSAMAKTRKAFIKAYRVARVLFVQGVRDVAFPEGTWLMREVFDVRCVPLGVT